MPGLQRSGRGRGTDVSLARVKHPAEANDAVRGEVDWLGRARANPSDEGKKGTSYFPPSAEPR